MYTEAIINAAIASVGQTEQSPRQHISTNRFLRAHNPPHSGFRNRLQPPADHVARSLIDDFRSRRHDRGQTRPERTEI